MTDLKDLPWANIHRSGQRWRAFKNGVIGFTVGVVFVVSATHILLEATEWQASTHKEQAR